MCATYTDLNHEFLVNGHDILYFDADDISESIGNILTTDIYTRPFNRGFGSNLLAILFMPMNSTTANLLITNLIDAVQRWEPRVKVNRQLSWVTADYNNRQYTARVVYNYIITNASGSYSLVFNAQSAFHPVQ